MKTILIDEIIELDRQRQEYAEDKLNDLSTSIQQKGLLHPLVLQNDGKTLVAGGRRKRAIQLLYDLDISFTFDGQSVPLGSVPFVTIGELSEDDLIEAELEENTLREDLHWREQADAIAKLHALRSRQNPNQTIRATAQELARDDQGYNSKDRMVKEAVILSEHLDNPEIAKAKSRKEAMKILKRQKEQEMTAQLAQSFDVSKTPHILNHGDFRDFTHLIETGSVDVICTDPPYGIDANNFGDQAGAAHGYEDSPEYFEEIIKAFIVEASRVAKDKAHLYAFCDPRRFEFIRQHLERHGWSVWPTPLIWSKTGGMLPRPDHGPRRTYECIVYAIRGDKKIRAVYADVISIQNLSNPKFGAEKPSSLYLDLLRRSVYPGDVVWEPFTGAGGIFAAANELSVRVIGTELIKEKYEYALLRQDEELGGLEELLNG